jgi:hypothetical protein
MEIRYFAYTYMGKRAKLVQSHARESREIAAQTLFEQYPKLKSVETCRAHYNERIGEWQNNGFDIQPVRRPVGKLIARVSVEQAFTGKLF